MFNSENEDMDEIFDVVVVGCGVAGLSAAVSAAQRGLNVCVLERATRDERGGQSRYTEAYLRMKSLDEVADDFEEHLAENTGRYMDPDLMAEMALDRASWSQITRSLAVADADVLSTFATQVPEAVQWLRGMGVRFDFLPTQFLTSSQPRLLPVGGGEAMVETLATQAEALGVTFHYECTARDLVFDTHGAVAGVWAWKRNAGRRRYAGTVVLASGGFEGNPEMLAHYLGPRSVYLRPVCKGGYYNKGEGIAMALRAGAAPAPRRAAISVVTTRSPSTRAPAYRSRPCSCSRTGSSSTSRDAASPTKRPAPSTPGTNGSRAESTSRTRASRMSFSTSA